MPYWADSMNPIGANSLFRGGEFYADAADIAARSEVRHVLGGDFFISPLSSLLISLLFAENREIRSSSIA
jgi:hypothetical protein